MGRPPLQMGQETYPLSLRVSLLLKATIEAEARNRGCPRADVLREIMRLGWREYQREHLVQGGVRS